MAYGWSPPSRGRQSRESPQTGAVAAPVPDAVLAHHLHQHALAQAAVGNPQPPAREGAAHSIENGAAGEHEIGALGADAGIGDTILVAPAEQPLDHAGDLGVAHPAAVDAAAVVAGKFEEHAGDRRYGAGGTEHVHAIHGGPA